MLVRNALWVDNGELRACLQVRLPGEGRKIQAELAAEILTMVLPDLLSASLYCTPQILQGLEQHYAVLERRRLILEELPKRGLVAFVPDGAVLPRASGLSQDPLQGAVPFPAPDELAVTLDVGGESIRGMGIPKGVTVITGGAYHGKSTLLQALVRSVYPHVPGDGREGIVIDESAMRVGVEDGRYVRETDISPMVRDLPGGVSTKSFSTAGASGSTREAANLMESMGDDREPLIPLTDRIRQFAEGGYSFILVAGACGDFLSLADNIVVMAEYRAEWVKASSVTLEARVPEPAEGADRVQGLQSAAPTRFFLNYTKVLPKVRPASAVERQVKVKLNGDTALQVGQLIADVSRAGLLVDRQQRVGAGYLLLNLLQNAEDVPVCELAEKLCEKIRNVGFRNLPQGMSRYMSLPRAVDLAAVLFRLH